MSARPVLIACLSLVIVANCKRGHDSLPGHSQLQVTSLDSLRFRGTAIRTVNGIAFDQFERKLFAAAWQDDRDAQGRRRLRIVEWQCDDSTWNGPHVPPFSRTPYTDYQPVYSHNRQRLYFQSTRPVPGDSVEVLQNLWYVERRSNGWTAPHYIAELNTPYRDRLRCTDGERCVVLQFGSARRNRWTGLLSHTIDSRSMLGATTSSGTQYRRWRERSLCRLARALCNLQSLRQCQSQS